MRRWIKGSASTTNRRFNPPSRLSIKSIEVDRGPAAAPVFCKSHRIRRGTSDQTTCHRLASTGRTFRIAGLRAVRVKAARQKSIDAVDCVGLGIGTDLEKFVVIQNSETFLIGWVPAVSSFLFVPLDHKSQVLSRWRECYFGTAASMRLPAEMEH